MADYTCLVRRWTLRILLCLILGAITTVAVAWGCMLAWRPDHVAFFEVAIDSNPAAQLLVAKWDYPEPLVVEELFSIGYTTPGWTEHYVEYAVGVSSFLVLQAGWPMRCLRGDYWGEADHPSGYVHAWMIPTTLRSVVGDSWRYFPLRPIWPGFVIDTLFYAAIWGGVFFGFTSAKRIIRTRRGRCPRCGYDLRGNLVEQVSDLRGFGRLSKPPPPPAQRAGETSHGSESRATNCRATSGCPECGWGRNTD